VRGRGWERKTERKTERERERERERKKEREKERERGCAYFRVAKQDNIVAATPPDANFLVRYVDWEVSRGVHSHSVCSLHQANVEERWGPHKRGDCDDLLDHLRRACDGRSFLLG
jgi:hypothetical protein